MVNNKIQLSNGTVLLDLTGDTVDASHLMQGYTAHDKSGAAIVGTATGGAWPPSPIVAGDTPVIISSSIGEIPSSRSSLVKTGVSITVPKDGTYRFKWGIETDEGTIYSRLYQNGTAVGTQKSNNNHNNVLECIENLTCNAGDEITIWGRAGSSGGYSYGRVSRLVACIAGDNGF